MCLNLRDHQLKIIMNSESESHSVMSDSSWPHGLYSPWNSLGQNTGVGSLFLLQGIFPTQGSNPGLPYCSRFLPTEPQGKPKNTGVGSLYLLQGIFLTQGLNRGLLHCRQKKGYPLQYSGLEISMDCRVQEVAKSRTQLSDFHFHFCRKPTVFPLSTCFSGQHRRRIPKAIPLFYDFTWLTIWTTASPLWDGVEFFP